uniref:Uncharacterized protein n=1 Tax=Glossina palpalis gambiensis TaxID=67801 RepID=A0A1B0BY95_9MUSC
MKPFWIKIGPVYASITTLLTEKKAKITLPNDKSSKTTIADKTVKIAGGDKLTPKGKSAAKLAKTGAGKGISPGGEGAGDADDLDAWIKSRQLLKPDDQLELTEAELGEEITKVLTPTNTNLVLNFVVYSFKEGTFVKIPPAGDTVTIFQLAGECSGCCIIGILALDFVLAKPWCDGLDRRYWLIRNQDILDSGVQPD